MLRLDNVSFGYGEEASDATAILEDASLALGAGELVCVVGPNGAGKTTMLRLAAGLLAPTGGAVRVDGKDPMCIARNDLAKKLAYLPQEYALSFPFTVAEVIMMGRYPHRGRFQLEDRDDHERCELAMRECDIEPLAARRFDTLSGGERRRALLAQAFCQATSMVLLDEPTASLDPAHALAVFRLLKSGTDTRAALVVTHDLNLAARFADRVLLVHQRRVTKGGTAKDVLTSPEAQEAFQVSLHMGSLPQSGDLFVVPE